MSEKEPITYEQGNCLLLSKIIEEIEKKKAPSGAYIVEVDVLCSLNYLLGRLEGYYMGGR